jgi:ubiquinone/menaquinone biosynthesis C-methylase UbiE
MDRPETVEPRGTASPASVPVATAPVAVSDAEPDYLRGVPDYLRDTYTWAYLHPHSVRWLDRTLVVQTILWGQFRRLVRTALEEFRPGQRVLQPACVYGDLSQRLAERVGPTGHLQVSDVAPVQLANVRPKLAPFAHAHVERSDAADHPPAAFDAVCCFFLLHEVPAERRRDIVAGLLRSVRPGGKVVFVDYYRPRSWHPLKPLMSLVFDTLEPFAKGLWHEEIEDMAEASAGFTWTKRTRFGGLYQKVVAVAR